MSRPRVALLVTCLVDVFRPRIAEAAVAVLERCGFDVGVPAQTCCGQVNANGGDEPGARTLARGVMRGFAGYEHIVVPSGSCAGFIRNHYPRLCAADAPERGAAAGFAARVQEFTRFLCQLPGSGVTGREWPGAITYQDSCSCRRELGITREPRRLLEGLAGLELREMPDGEECCGFGGLFSTKYPEISAAMADRKIESIQATGAGCVVGADAGCLMHLAGRMHRRGIAVGVLHVAEVLDGVRPADVDE